MSMGNVICSFKYFEECFNNYNTKLDHGEPLSSSIVKRWLALKAPITTAADDIHEDFFIVLQRK